MSFNEKTALITGASRGIGKAIALKLAEGGANLVLNFSGNVEKAEETKTACEAFGVKVILSQGNVSQGEDVKKIFALASEAFGSVDILVNNAGITRDNLLMKMTDEDYDMVMDTNLRGAFLCTREATRPMMKKRWGRIVNISSVVGILGQAGQANYATSKAGMIGLTKSVARELAPRNITVNAIAPGFIQTDMTDALSEEQKEAIAKNIPLARMGTGEDIAGIVAFLSSESGSYITGQVLSVDGGLAI
ncbi:MAG: 3-oxoacyl-[acyl-carrier-protein] reductase [Eubacteriales bacterium]